MSCSTFFSYKFLYTSKTNRIVLALTYLESLHHLEKILLHLSQNVNHFSPFIYGKKCERYVWILEK